MNNMKVLVELECGHKIMKGNLCLTERGTFGYCYNCAHLREARGK